MKRNIAMIATALLAVASIAAPAHPATRASVSASDEMTEAGLWLAKVDDAIAVSSTALQVALNEIRPKLPALLDQRQAKALVPELRARLVRARSELVRSNQLLAEIRTMSTPSLLVDAGVPTQQMLADIEAQNGQFRDLLSALDEMFVAMAAGKRDAIMAAVPKLLQGSFLIVDSKLMALRNHRASLKSDEAAYQTISIQMQLYVVMGNLMRAAVDDMMGADRDAHRLASQLRDSATALRALTKTGRANSARERIEIEGALRLAKSDTDVIKRTQRVLAIEGEIFDLGDELAIWAERTAVAVDGKKLDRPLFQQLAGELKAIEDRFFEISGRQSQALIAETG